MIASSSIICTVILAVLSSLITADDPCRFVSPTKGVIDLTSLGRTDGQAAYPDAVPPSSNYKYSYNPCKPFSEAYPCFNVSVCQASLDERFLFALGTEESAQWKDATTEGADPTISYSLYEKRSIVYLHCAADETNQFEALGEDPMNVYNFRLTHKCACWNGCKAPPQQNCSINGSAYTSDKEIIQSLPFHVFINPPPPLPLFSSYAKVDTNSHVIELTLINIEYVPTAIFCLSQLKVLSLLNSENVTIPPEIVRLASSLKSFNVSSISKSLALPSELFTLTQLSTLSIVNCGLETLSEDIDKLDQLTELILDQNQLSTLPATLNKLSSLTTLSVIGNNPLSSLDSLNGSPSLTILRAANCLIDHLPTNISNLHTIEMDGNKLTSLEGIETITSSSCDKLLFDNNQIMFIPLDAFENVQTIVYLDLSSNQLSVLPDSLYRINDLQTLNIVDNQFNEQEKEWIQGLFRLTKTTLYI